MSKVTLKPGDYVRTEGMTKEQYHAVAKALIEAGASKGDYPRIRDIGGDWLFGWGSGGTGSGILCHSVLEPHMYKSWFEGGRELTIAQILGTEPEPMTIEQLLAKANKHAAKAQKHERKKTELFMKAAELIPAGYVLREKVDGEVDLIEDYSLDMQDPANWKAGDVVECVESSYESVGGRAFVAGKRYAMREDYDVRSSVKVRRDEFGGENGYPAKYFRWISRPSAQGEE